MFATVACTNFEYDIEDDFTHKESSSGDVITIHGSVARFSDYEVGTRANKTPEESHVSRMALAVFPIDDNGVIGNCVNYTVRHGDNLLYTLDRSLISEDYKDKNFALYIFTNMPGLPTDNYKGSLDSLLDLALANPHITRPEDGFPMIGSLGDVNRDGKEFILMPIVNGRMELPKVNGKPTDYLNIPMNAVFAKISFEISVTTEEDVAIHDHARFEMTGYEVHNIASSVSFNETLNEAIQQEVNADSIKVTLSGIAQGGEDGGSVISFDFYLPERLLEPQTRPEQYAYPLPHKDTGEIPATGTGYSNIDDDYKKYAQRYKPLLLGENQKATYVTIQGKFRDHQEHYHDVSYNIYLGADNYRDFNIKRNSQYINKLNIKGITSSADQSTNMSAVSIDHRVNVERSSPLIVSLRRETQLDAHYEVRPMRLRFAQGVDVPNNAKVTVKVLNEDGTEGNTWIRVEQSDDSDDHIKEGTSQGKRKYFTTTLMDDLDDEVSVPRNDLMNGTVVWVYVDEAPYDKATPTRTSRTAILRVTYDDGEETVDSKDIKDYHIRQFNLHKIQGNDNPNPYYIECYEEFLYNYDSEDSYGQTKEEGMPWGLDGEQLSKKHKSFKIDENNDDWNEYYNAAYNEDNSYMFYDFYIGKHDAKIQEKNKAPVVRNFAGQDFTKEIVSTAGIQYLTMAEQASSAVQYCYNRNKRKADGTVDVKWYLPSADELEDFIVTAYSYYEEFQENFYWTSQPAYIKNIFYYEYKTRGGFLNLQTVTEDAYGFEVYEENTGYARASKVYNDLTPAPSGLNDKPKTERTDIPWSDNPQVLGYYNLWYAWKKPVSGDATLEKWDKNKEAQAVYTEYKNETKGSRYGAYLGHLDDLKQEGYMGRMESHRVRCAYRP